MANAGAVEPAQMKDGKIHNGAHMRTHEHARADPKPKHTFPPEMVLRDSMNCAEEDESCLSRVRKSRKAS